MLSNKPALFYFERLNDWRTHDDDNDNDKEIQLLTGVLVTHRHGYKQLNKHHICLFLFLIIKLLWTSHIRVCGHMRFNCWKFHSIILATETNERYSWSAVVKIKYLLFAEYIAAHIKYTHTRLTKLCFYL